LAQKNAFLNPPRGQGYPCPSEKELYTEFGKAPRVNSTEGFFNVSEAYFHALIEQVQERGRVCPAHLYPYLRTAKKYAGEIS
jgi:hypothetical protein